MFPQDLNSLLQNPLYLMYEGVLFALGAAPVWHLIERLIDRVLAKKP
jgi:hypothetical protein